MEAAERVNACTLNHDPPAYVAEVRRLTLVGLALNLFLAALTSVTGDFPRAVQLSSEVLAIVGRIYPSTKTNVSLRARLADGTELSGETNISKSNARIKKITLIPSRCRPLRETLDAIASADLVCLGPGSLFTSLIPNLLVGGIPKAIQESPAVKAYFVNLMWQPGETMDFSAYDHVRAIHQHARRKLMDYVVVNTRPISGALRRKYAAQQVYPVNNDTPLIAEAGMKVVGSNLLAKSKMVRHNPQATAAVAVRLAEEGRRRKTGKS